MDLRDNRTSVELMRHNSSGCWTIDVDGSLKVKVDFDAWTNQWQSFRVRSANATITLHFRFQAWSIALVLSLFGANATITIPFDLRKPGLCVSQLSLFTQNPKPDLCVQPIALYKPPDHIHNIALPLRHSLPGLPHHLLQNLI